MKTQLPAFAEEELKDFLESRKPGSITFHSDGQVIRQAEVKTVRRDDKTK